MTLLENRVFVDELVTVRPYWNKVGHKSNMTAVLKRRDIKKDTP